VHFFQGKLDLAEPDLRYVLKKHIELLGEDHPRTRVGKVFLAVLFRRQRKYDEAAQLFEEVLAKFKEKPGSNEEALFPLGELVQTLLEAKKLDKARPRVEEYLMGQDKQPSSMSSLLANQQGSIALLLVKNKQYPEAEKLLRRSLAFREREQPGAWFTFDTQSMLGAALLGQKKYAEAESLLLKGYEGMKQRENAFPKGAINIREAIDRLIELYTVTNRTDEAKKWEAERAKYPAEMK
jgi:hypothetical protein